MTTPGAIKRYTQGTWNREGCYVLNVPTTANLPASPDDDGVFAYLASEDRLYRSKAGAWAPAGGVAIYPDYATLVAQWPSPPDGSLAVLANEPRTVVRAAGVWHSLGTAKLATGTNASISPITAPVSLISISGLVVPVPVTATVNVTMRIDTLDTNPSAWTFRLEGTGFTTITNGAYLVCASGLNAYAYGIHVSHTFEMAAGSANTVSFVAVSRPSGTGAIRTFGSTSLLEVRY